MVLIPSEKVLSVTFVIPSGKGEGRLAVPPDIERIKSAKLNSPLPCAVLYTGSLNVTLTVLLLGAIFTDTIMGNALSWRFKLLIF